MPNPRLRWREMLPIVTREMRAASKRRFTYRLRFVVALIGSAQVILGPIFLSGFSVELGKTLFVLTAFLVTLLCAGAGLVLTADSVSREKREGTLGLLFLTRLTSFDIILGKLSVGFLTGGSVACAAFPFLAFSLCLGGVTARDFWVMTALLIFLLMFSLTLGIFISVLFRKESTVALAFFFVMFIPAAALPLVIMKWTTVPLLFARWNPLYPILSTFDTAGFFLPAEHAWPTLIFQFFLLFVMLALSCLILPWTIRAKPLRAKTISVAWTRRFRRAVDGRILDANPFLWLGKRHNHPLLLLYVCIALRLLAGVVTTVPFEAEVTYVVILAILPKIFVLWHASGMIAEERQSGFLQALLTTPMTASEIVSGKIRAIQRQVAPAVLFALAVQWATSTRWWAEQRDIPISTTVVLAVMITLMIDVYTGAWIGLWQGLLARDRRRALIRSFAWGIIGPWVVPFVVFILIAFIFDPRWMNQTIYTLPPSIISANIISFALACFAMARLHDTFRSCAMQKGSLRAGA